MNIVTRPGLLRNLQIGFGLSLLILIVTSVASYSSIQNLMDGSRWVDHTDSVIIKVDNVISILKDAESNSRGYLLTSDSTFIRQFNNTQNRVSATIDSIESMTFDNPNQRVNIKQLRENALQPLVLMRTVMDQKRTDNLFNVADLQKARDYMTRTRQILTRMLEEEHRLMVSRVESVRKYSGYTPILIVVASLLSILITLVFYARVHKDFLERASLYAELQEKDQDITRRIGIIGSLADKISAGDYRTRVTDDQKDSLGSLSGSLNKMAESLEYSFGLLSDKEWLQTGVARLNELMMGQTDMTTLVSSVIGFMAEYTGSRLGALYIVDPVTHDLTLGSHHGLSPDSRRQKIKVGDGLIGQVALDGKRALLQDIPPGEWVVNLTSGNIKPRSIVVFALTHEKKIRGVMELGTLEYFTDRELEFFTNVSESIGIAIHSIETRVKLQELLEETQAQTEELQAQHSELENMNMELEVQAEKLQVSEEELKVQQEELQQTNQELEERSRSLEEKNHLILIRNLDIQKKAEELALTTKYKSEFMANMSHELRTPLNSILLLSRLLSENKGHNLSADEMEYARVIQSSGKGLLELIDEILDLSRIESGKLQLEHAIVNIDDIVNDMKMLFVPLARDKNLDLFFEIAEGTPTQLETDKMRLEQILKNLLSNAFKFTPKGSITMRIGPSPFLKNYLDISVKDTGIGISEDKHQLIFEAFQQADGSTRRKYGGTGLGLSISRELAKLLGGEISLVSTPGEGAEFKVSIPQFKMEGEPEQPLQAPPREALLMQKEEPPLYTLSDIPADVPDDRDDLQPGDKCLLIVEDDRVFGTALLEFGRKKGYKGVVIVRGDKAVQAARTYKPQGILLDIQLPLKNGWDIMEELKKDPETRHIPVHIISSFEVKHESIQKGAIDYISKAAAFENMDSVFSKIEYVLNRSSKKVLIVEDNTRHAEALSFFLGTHNVQSEIAHTIAGSIASLDKKEVDCVILSRESQVDGIAEEGPGETLDTIRQNPGLENIPIIVLTGKSISKTEELRLRQYADSIVVKTAHSYQRILDEVSLFLHLVDEGKEKQPSSALGKLGALEEVLKNRSVLIADDDVRNIFSLTKALETHKMKVFSAMDGKEALTFMQEGIMPVDIILMDMMMPEMDGFETIARIRRNPRWKNIPIIAVTAKAMAGDRERCIQAGASDYISKPVDIDQLMSLLRIWLYEK